MIARAMKLAGLQTSLNETGIAAELSSFTDQSQVAPWARGAVAAAVQNQLVKGNQGRLLPNSNITRAETAAIVERMLVNAKLILLSDFWRGVFCCFFALIQKKK